MRESQDANAVRQVWWRQNYLAPMLLLGVGVLGLALISACNGVNIPDPTPKVCPASCPVGTACTDPAKGCQPIPPPGPVCEVGVEHCDCFVMPPETGLWEEIFCPQGQVCTTAKQCATVTPPPSCPACAAGYSCADPAVGCIKDPTPPGPPEAPLIRDEELTKVGVAAPSQMWDETSKAINRWRALHPEKWNAAGTCLSAGPAGIDDAFLGISSELLRVKIIAGQSIDANLKRSDCTFVNRPTTDLYEEGHLFDYARGCVATGPNAMLKLYRRSGTPPPPIEPPPAQGACSAPQPPKVGKWGGPKPHNRTNDSTPQFYNKAADRWDGSIVTGFCDLTGWNGTRLFCPARMECKPPEEPGPQNFKCEERPPCEEIGVAGRYGGRPLWRSDGTVELSDNPFQATCSGCTWLEVCAADGTVCSRCAISPATGLCEVTP